MKPGKNISLLLSAFMAVLGSCNTAPKDGTYTFHVLSTNDVHGSFFDSPLAGEEPKNSLSQIKWYVDSVRSEVGRENVVLIDAGDCLQGDNAAYYFNYVDTLSRHIWPRMVKDIGYDALTVGNHDIETGHPVYDRIYDQLRSYNLPYLAANAFKEGTGESYFDSHVLLKRNGLRILILGYTNANMKGWLDESIWKGMEFASLIPLVQEDVDRLRKELTPHIVIVSTHSGTGKGDGLSLESQGLDLLNSLEGVDFIICSHDHSATTVSNGRTTLLNSGSHARNIAHGSIELVIKDGEVVSRKVSEGDLLKVDPSRVDKEFSDRYRDEFEAVRSFTQTRIGSLEEELRTRDAYCGPSDYMNLLHYLSISRSGAALSFCAPLTFNGTVESGDLIFNDLFTLYPYENQLYVMSLKGSEILNYLEYSYDQWIQNPEREGHALRIVNAEDRRNSRKSWSFIARSYNFDSCAGLLYTVDITRSKGGRISIQGLADGSEFDMDRYYDVAMTSYRAAGGGSLLEKGAGLTKDEMEGRIVKKLPQIREIVYDYIREKGKIDAADFNRPEILGNWSFVPERIAAPALKKDMSLLFGD